MRKISFAIGIVLVVIIALLFAISNRVDAPKPVKGPLGTAYLTTAVVKGQPGDLIRDIIVLNPTGAEDFAFMGGYICQTPSDRHGLAMVTASTGGIHKDAKELTYDIRINTSSQPNQTCTGEITIVLRKDEQEEVIKLPVTVFVE